MSEPRKHYGKIISVEQRLGTLRVDFDLGFGVHLDRLVDIEGLDASAIDAQYRDALQHCLVVLLVGTRCVMLTQQREGHTIARVYVRDKVKAPPTRRGVMVTPPGEAQEMLAVGPFVRWLAGSHYDVELLKAVLNGKPHAAITANS